MLLTHQPQRRFRNRGIGVSQVLPVGPSSGGGGCCVKIHLQQTLRQLLELKTRDRDTLGALQLENGGARSSLVPRLAVQRVLAQSAAGRP